MYKRSLSRSLGQAAIVESAAATHTAWAQCQCLWCRAGPAFWACDGVVTVGVHQDALVAAAACFGRQDSILPLLEPGELDMEIVAAARAHGRHRDAARAGRGGAERRRRRARRRRGRRRRRVTARNRLRVRQAQIWGHGRRREREGLEVPARPREPQRRGPGRCGCVSAFHMSRRRHDASTAAHRALPHRSGGVRPCRLMFAAPRCL
mmetsp:Transcript_46430/g.92889  ORF Transcript_46430/g.92889 Transcript_46430/m.92889 type:complete len:207 (+) Transcript_46430:40-660(+)